MATVFTWAMTAFGAALVFFVGSVKRSIFDTIMGFAAGVMIAASFWSLLSPAIEMAEEQNIASWIPALTGFMVGGLFLYVVDRLLPHMSSFSKNSKPEGPKTSLHRSILLVLAVTLHNIPEGLAVGVAFGALAINSTPAAVAGALALAVGIGIQNFPEGAVVSLPLRTEGFSKWKSFLYGQASGLVEPIAGVLGALAVIVFRPVLPYALSFAAGAMIYVVVEELIPESHREHNAKLATLGVFLGFGVMMTLDVALG